MKILFQKLSHAEKQRILGVVGVLRRKHGVRRGAWSRRVKKQKKVPAIAGEHFIISVIKLISDN